MRSTALWLTFVTFAGCGAATSGPVARPALQLPATVSVMDGQTGRPMQSGELLARLAGADIVLLGEVHDNAVQHQVRAQLLTGMQASSPTVVFEQFAESRARLTPPADGRVTEAWLDANGFDRTAWKWPLHEPVVTAAIESGASVWGSGVSREQLRDVVRNGEAAAPEHLRSLLERAPLESAAQAALDSELIAGHCGQLPTAMVPGMRAAQTVRDASMANALLAARAASGGPAWLIAGNGHVRKDFAVPRILRAVAPDLHVVSVGFLERSATGAAPDADERAVYDVVVVTPRAERPDPCVEFRIRIF